VMLDDHLFSAGLESWEASVATGGGRIRLKLLHGTYHEKFKGMRVGQAWLVKGKDGFYLKAVFSRTVGLPEPDGRAVAVDVNENNAAFGSGNSITSIRTGERAIRTAYFLKRRRLQSAPRLNERPLLAKYRGRERRRINDLYHRIAGKITAEARRVGASAVVLEDLRNLRKKRSSKALNGRLNRWSFRRLQSIVDYKARLAGLSVRYVDARGTSSLCPTCGGRLSPNGYRLVRCPACGLEGDRDAVAVRNLLRRCQMDVGASSVRPESPPHDRRGEGMKVNAGLERLGISFGA